ncbi:MAG: tetratricopeptide repeat protein [Acidobacteria bacterium]|nr:tetratricopeptide repeat protein [Acidobacteriota bacterium]
MSCTGVALVVAAAGIVIVGTRPRDRSEEEKRTATPFIPAGQIGGAPESLAAGPVPIPDSTGPAPGVVVDASIVESLVLQAGETYYGKGEAFFKDGDFTSATRYLKAEVGEHPDRFYPSYLLGLSLWRDGKLDEAAAALASAAALDTRSVKARVNLGRVLNDAGRFGEALQSVDEAVALGPDDSPAHNVRGRALLNLGRRDEAIEAFTTAIEKDPANAHALNNLGYALIQAGRFADAVPYLEEAVRLKPAAGYFQNNLGMAYERTGLTDRAVGAYRAAVEAGGSEAAGRNLSRLAGTIDEGN